ncbi:hypothetical protein LTR08_007487 [Meristemomyces frigidus]|nr:hypothetical protein LTR08_007487 [Meristemomyces frigidus]
MASNGWNYTPWSGAWWSYEQENTLLEAIREAGGHYWVRILELHGDAGTQSQILKGRSKAGLESKARQLYQKKSIERPTFSASAKGMPQGPSGTRRIHVARKLIKRDKPVIIDLLDDDDNVASTPPLSRPTGKRVSAQESSQSPVPKQNTETFSLLNNDHVMADSQEPDATPPDVMDVEIGGAGSGRDEEPSAGDQERVGLQLRGEECRWKMAELQLTTEELQILCKAAFLQ